MSVPFRSIDSGPAHATDPDLLYALDRACLRLLVRCGSATPVQLAQLVYGGLRRTQERLLRLHRAGLLERTAVPRTTHGGRAEFAYRVSPLGHSRLGTRRSPAPASYLRHTLDTVEAICALSRNDDRENAPVQLWLTDAMTAGVLGRFVRPDSIAVVATDEGSAVLALEIDEGTEHARTIRAKLAAYRRPLAVRPTWHLLVVVPGAIREAWMIRQAASLDLGPHAWVLTRDALRAHALDVELRSLSARPSTRIIALLRPPRRVLPAPVGSRAWLELLASGGGEDEDGALRP